MGFGDFLKSSYKNYAKQVESKMDDDYKKYKKSGSYNSDYENSYAKRKDTINKIKNK